MDLTNSSLALQIFVMHTQEMSKSLHSIVKENFSSTFLLEKEGTISSKSSKKYFYELKVSHIP